MLLRISDPRVTDSHPQFSVQAFALSPNGRDVADLDVGPQPLQLIQPDHLLMREAVVGALDFHQLEEQFSAVSLHGNRTNTQSGCHWVFKWLIPLHTVDM